MADLKAGSTVGGLPIWHQGTMPLVPAGNSLTYKGYKVYTANDKPQAADNDFVSKAGGGQYLSVVSFKKGLQINSEFSGGSDQNGLYSGDGDGAEYTKCNIDIVSWYGFGLRSSQGTNGRTVVWNTRTGDQQNKGSIQANGQISSHAAAPSAVHNLTRKDYVDGQINTVKNNADSRVLKAGDTMTGTLTVPTIVLTKAAGADNQVPQRGQVVLKGTTIDFGSY